MLLLATLKTSMCIVIYFWLLLSGHKQIVSHVGCLFQNYGYMNKGDVTI